MNTSPRWSTISKDPVLKTGDISNGDTDESLSGHERVERPERKTDRLNARISIELHDKISAIATNAGMSLSEACVIAIKWYLDSYVQTEAYKKRTKAKLDEYDLVRDVTIRIAKALREAGSESQDAFMDAYTEHMPPQLCEIPSSKKGPTKAVSFLIERSYGSRLDAFATALMTSLDTAMHECFEHWVNAYPATTDYDERRTLTEIQRQTADKIVGTIVQKPES